MVVPSYLFQAMSFFNWTTWIAPNNVTLAILTGSLCGLGLNPWPTFDWNIVTSIVDPIVAPFFSTVNVTVGMAISAFFIVPLVYWHNAFNTAYLPIISNQPFDNTGARYNVSRILNSDYTLNVAKYEAYSRPYIGAGVAISYIAHFAITPAIVTYVLLYHWPELKTGVIAIIKRKDARNAHNDVHNRLMKAYKEVPEWWFGTILVVSFIFGCIACACYPTGMPIWAIILAVAMCVVLQVPIGIITAVTNIEVGNNVLAEFIAGYAIPHSPIANMIFKTFGFIGCAQSVQFSQDLKLGHYLKVPPRAMFAAQVYATIWGAFVAIGVNAWQMVHIKDLCQPDQSAQFTCPGNNSFFTSAIIWGVVGPKRLFGSGGLYNPLEWGFLIGAVLPIPFWLLTRKFPNSFVRYIHIPIILTGFTILAPYSFSFVWRECPKNNAASTICFHPMRYLRTSVSDV
jgi:OPT family small oligopeptide transporter